MTSIQPSLFNDKAELTPHIDGLVYVPDFIAPEEESELLNIIDQQPWITDLKRRVQHYGYRYDYTARNIGADSYLGEVPDWLQKYCEKLYEDGHFNKKPDQVIINEYQPGQGISAHIDKADYFGDRIGVISLGSPCVMEFSKNEIKNPVLLEQCSFAMMTGDSRYKWKHCIPNRKTDKYNGKIIKRDRRVSLTFRNVVLG